MDPLGPEIVSNKKQQMTKTPHSFLGENSALVNLDNLIKPVNNVTNNNAYNPFSESQPKNLFQQNQPPVSILQIICMLNYLFNNILFVDSINQSIETATSLPNY